MDKKVFNKVSGDGGELKAAEYLKKIGYKIIKINYTTKIGEVDIIAKDHTCYVFVEVKFRLSDYFGRPSEAVNIYKQRKIRNVATIYINKNRLFNETCRFDVIEILGDEINHIQNCF